MFFTYFLLFYRTCISAEAEPILNSSGCYPLVNFTRPFCENHGVTLSDYIYKTPHKQSYHNDEINKAYDQLVRIGVRKINRMLHLDNETAIKCAHAFVPFICHVYFPSCEGTGNEYKEQKICRETCLDLIRICGWKIWDFVVKAFEIRYSDPESKKLVHCKLQPYRNAGDSPECWYSDLEDSAGDIRNDEMLKLCLNNVRNQLY